MKTIKKRIKRALAALLREELLEYIGYNHNIPFMPIGERVRVDMVDMDTYVMERLIPIDQMNYGMGDPRTHELETLIRECKKEFAEQLMDHIHVDAQNLTSREHYMRRSVQFVLRVQKPKR